MTSNFWSEPQGAAVFKHAILRQYVQIFVRKVGHSSPGGRVGYLEGYAGAGAYDDGSPASPALALATAEALADVRDMRCYFVERERAVCDRLVAAVGASAVGKNARVIHGDITTELAGILSELEGAPLFAFLDPFGLGVPFTQLTESLLGRSGRQGTMRTGPPTEVMINFVHAGLYRTAGKLDVSSSDPRQVKSAMAIVDEVDVNLGGSWWQDVWRSDLMTTSDKVSTIRDEYLRRVLAAAGPGWASLQVPVSDLWKGKPIYDLILLTQHPQGIWFFNEAVSLAREVFEQHVQPESGSVLHLWAPEDEWDAVIESNMRRLLSRGRPINLVDEVADVYGATLGVARGTHVRKVLKRLYEAGETATQPKGDLHRLVVMPRVESHTG
jgi:three-Cys-motif partner protein